GIRPFAGSSAALRIREPPTRPALATPAPPAATPNVFRKPRRLVVDVLSMKLLPRKANCLIVDPREQPRYYYIISAECEQPGIRRWSTISCGKGPPFRRRAAWSGGTLRGPLPGADPTERGHRRPQRC